MVVGGLPLDSSTSAGLVGINWSARSSIRFFSIRASDSTPMRTNTATPFCNKGEDKIMA